MARIDPLPRDQLGEFEDLFKTRDRDMGFTSNSMLTMARWPELLENWMSLTRTVMFKSSDLSQELKHLISHIVSRASGCRYCTAHTANHSAGKVNITERKIEAAFEYETSALFSEAERAALRVAQLAGAGSDHVTDDDFDRLKQYFTDRQIVEIVAVISLFGFLNRWNDTLAVELEDAPLSFAQDHLASTGWSPGKHRLK